MRDYIDYRGPGGPSLLAPGSTAHKLASDGKTKELHAHMLEVQRRHQALLAAIDARSQGAAAASGSAPAQ